MTEVTERALNAAGAKVTYLRDPHDRAIRRALGGEVDAVVVISNDDTSHSGWRWSWRTCVLACRSW